MARITLTRLVQKVQTSSFGTVGSKQDERSVPEANDGGQSQPRYHATRKHTIPHVCTNLVPMPGHAWGPWNEDETRSQDPSLGSERQKKMAALQLITTVTAFLLLVVFLQGLFGAYAIFVTALFIFVDVGYFLQAFCRVVVQKLTSTQRSILAISEHVFFVLPCHLDLMLHMNNARYVWDRFTVLKGLPKNETPLGHS